MPGRERGVGGKRGDARAGRGGGEPGEETGEVLALPVGEGGRGVVLQPEQGGEGGRRGGGHGAGQRGVGGAGRGLDAGRTAWSGSGPGPGTRTRAGRQGCHGERGPCLGQGHRAHLESGLEGERVDGVVGEGVDAEVLAEQVVPVEGGEAVPGSDPVGDDGGQHGPPAPGGHLHPVALLDAERGGVLRVDLHERSGVELAQLGDLAGLGQGVPLVLQPAGVEYERVVVVGEFAVRQVRAGEEDGPSRRRREDQPGAAAVRALGQGLADPVVEVADRVAVRPARGGRPLHRARAQPLVRDPAQVPARLRVPGLPELLEHLLGTGVRERLGEPHRAGDPGDQLPVGQGLAGRVGRALHEGEVALRVDHHAVRLGPQRRGQCDVGVGMGLGLREHVLGDDEFGGLQGLDDGAAVGDGGDRVGADDPARLDLTGSHLLEHLDGAAADVGAQGALRDAPQLLDVAAVLLHQDRALAGQPRSHVAHLPSAHRIGLAGEGEGAAARAADGAGGEVQVDQGVGVPGAVGGLVEAHGPAAHPLARLADPAGRQPDVGLRYAGDPGDLAGRVVLKEGGHVRPALGVLGDEVGVGPAALDQEVQQAVEEGQVGARPDL